MKKIIPILLVLTMAVGLLTGCGASMDKINENTNIVVATIGDQDIYAYELIYLLKMGATKEEALNEIQTLKTFVEKSKEYNIELTEEDFETVEQQWTDSYTQFGSEEDFIKELENYGITAEQYKEILKMLALCEKFNAEFENLGLIETTTDETAAGFYDNNFLRAKHILFTTQDDAGQKLSDEEINAKRAKAEDVLKKINDGAAFEDFVDLSEDPGSAASPDGYTFLNTQSDTLKDNQTMLGIFQQVGIPVMVTEFEQGTANIEVGAVSEIVESDFGFHIIKRLDLHGEGNEWDQMKPVIVYVIDSMNYNGVVEGWKAELKQKTNKYYEVLEVEPATPTQQPQPEVAPEAVEGEQATEAAPEEAATEAATTEAAPAAE